VIIAHDAESDDHDEPAGPLLELRGITKHFPGVLAASDVTLALCAGEILGLVGKNGAGKSTIIKIIAGAERPDQGEIWIDNLQVELQSPHDATRYGISVVHQELSDIPNLSVAENLQIGLRFPKRAGLVRWKALRRRAQEILDLLEIDLDPGALVGSLSTANQRLVMIARGLASEARLLVLDEPTASLTDAEIHHLHALLRRLRDAGTSVVYVSHRLDEILKLTDRVVVMRGGEVTGIHTTSGLDQRALIGEITGKGDHFAVEERPTESSEIGPVLLEADGLSAGSAVRDVSFQLRSGELLGIAGLVGAGRTELMRLVYGADEAEAGRVVIRGDEQKAANIRGALRAGLVLLPEDRRHQGLIQDFSVRKNITLASLNRFRRVASLPFPSAQQERMATKVMIGRLSIQTSDLDGSVRTLSGGNQQKVVLGKWLQRGAEIFIFDEPTHGIDVEGKEDVYRLMRELTEAGRGVVFISSEFSELVRCCSRVLVMREGRIIKELVETEITEQNLLFHCYRDQAASAGVPPYPLSTKVGGSA
jgi:ABC-type sugar transport system ATPase subunit